MKEDSTGGKGDYLIHECYEVKNDYLKQLGHGKECFSGLRPTQSLALSDEIEDPSQDMSALPRIHWSLIEHASLKQFFKRLSIVEKITSQRHQTT